MIWISHRGNLRGRDPEMENNPEYIDKAIEAGFDVEIDLWLAARNEQADYWLGHDNPQYPISFEWLEDRVDKLWIHCKATMATGILYSLNNVRKHEEKPLFHFFAHETDTVAFTSKGFMINYPGKLSNTGFTIAMLPEIHNEVIDRIVSEGICSDRIAEYREKFEDYPYHLFQLKDKINEYG